MFRKPFIALAALAALAAAATTARADDITMDNSVFMSTKTRAEVRAEALSANATGTTRVSEVDLSSTMARKAPTTLTRDQVRAEAVAAARKAIMEWYPA